MSWNDWLAIGSFCVAGVALLLKFLDRNDRRQEDLRIEWRQADEDLRSLLKEMHGEFSDMHSEIEVMKKQMEVFWKGVAYNAASLLHSPHTPETDALIEKFVGGTINREELDNFKEHLLFIASSKDEGNIRSYLARQVLLILTLMPEIKVEPIPYLLNYHLWRMKHE